MFLFIFIGIDDIRVVKQVVDVASRHTHCGPKQAPVNQRLNTKCHQVLPS